jgi:hypothetical protein
MAVPRPFDLRHGERPTWRYRYHRDSQSEGSRGRNEKITYKVREHSLAKVPVLLVVGKKEAAERIVSIRRLGSPEQIQMGLDAALKLLVEEATPPDVSGVERLRDEFCLRR